MRISIPAVAMILSLGAFQAKAHEGGSEAGITQNRFEISYADLNLSNEQDARVMLARIERGARRACGGHASFSSYTGGLESSFYECRDRAVRQAIEQLASPLVSRLYRERQDPATAQHGNSTVRHAKSHLNSEPLYFAQ